MPEVLLERHSAREKYQHRSAHAQRRRRDGGNAPFGAQLEDPLPLVEDEEIETVDVKVGTVEKGFRVALVDASLEADQSRAPG